MSAGIRWWFVVIGSVAIGGAAWEMATGMEGAWPVIERLGLMLVNSAGSSLVVLGVRG